MASTYSSGDRQHKLQSTLASVVKFLVDSMSRSVWTNAGVLYEVGHRIGSGSFGKVFIGIRHDNARVALKFINSKVGNLLPALLPLPSRLLLSNDLSLNTLFAHGPKGPEWFVRSETARSRTFLPSSS